MNATHHRLRRLAPLVLLLLLPLGCANEESKRPRLSARQITRADELIGGPTARGKLGDFLIENDRVRFVIGGLGQSWMGGVFGGSLLDADRQRPALKAYKYGKGWDAFGETFPLVNLVVANPDLPGSSPRLTSDGIKLIEIPSGIEVLKDGSDGEAVVRVTGRAGYMFEVLKFLNRDFLMSYLAQPFKIMGFELPIDQLLNMLLGVNVYALVNRLQIDFTFHNDYILHEGESFLTLRTTVIAAPPTQAALDRCPASAPCGLECEHGLAMTEAEYDIPGQTTKTPGKVMCPVCRCADAPQPMQSLNESEDIFGIMLGDLGPWTERAWKGGLLGGDFLFFGAEANIFSPGIGFDDNRKIFENMWQQVPTLSSPLTFPWIAGVGENVSYAWATVNPDRREGRDCPTWRLAMTRLSYEDEQAVIDALVTELKWDPSAAAARVRQVIVDRKPLVLREVPMDAKASQSFESWKAAVILNVIVSGDPKNPDARTVISLFPEAVGFDLLPAAECLDASVLIPIVSTSATAVMTHKATPTMDIVDEQVSDLRRSFTFERYLVVGDGDVGSVLSTIYDLKGISYGRVSGVVVDEATRIPLSKVAVFAIRDPRSSPDDPEPATYGELRSLCRGRFGNEGLVSQMETDLGLDLVLDGDFAGPLEPGSYFLVAFAPDRAPSAPVPVVINEQERSVANLILPSTGKVHYLVRDGAGLKIPARLTFISLDAEGKPMRWDGKNPVELGASRYDHGIYLTEHSAHGEGEVRLPPGHYRVLVSRGFEYSLGRFDDFEVKAGITVPLETVLLREVDTTGWISGDFHVHAVPSIDSSLLIEDRVAANVAEGVEFITATDHDYLTDYSPYIHKMGLQKHIRSEVGVETTTLEFGHYNGFPMKYDQTDIPVHDSPPWYGETIARVWEMLRERLAPGFAADDFIVQVNHPRDGFMGYFAQFGLKGYNLERKTPGMEMCNPQTEKIPCNFDTFELMNEKRFELLRTPTIAEKEMHNVCFEAIMKCTDKSLFGDGNGRTLDELLCADLRFPAEECATLPETLKTTTATGMDLARLQSAYDHCLWHQEFVGEFTHCTDDMPLVECKKQALDALKLLTVRYQLERLPEEQDAYFATSSATDIGCDMKKAMNGCSPMFDKNQQPSTGCGGADCSCEPCVCGKLPSCCQPIDWNKEETLGNGWTQACADLCRSECYGCGIQPCTSKAQVWEDWYSFLNHGFNPAIVGNSDSHDVKAEVGLPRNYIRSSTDFPLAIDAAEIFRNIKAHRVFLSTGPFVEFSIGSAGIGDTLAKPGGKKLEVRVRIQTASWFGVDHIEIHRNGKIEKILRLAPAPETLVDFDQVVELDMPQEDSWYVLTTYGLDSRYLLSPVYKRIPLGKMLIPTIIALGAKALLTSFPELTSAIQTKFGNLLGGASLETLLGSAFGIEELPDSFPMFPLAITNPIWVDLDGKGFAPPLAKDSDQDGQWDLPPFCVQPCQVEVLTAQDGTTSYGQATCGENQRCIPDSQGSAQGTCAIPIPENCVGAQTKQ
ncbi:MAG: hypothetical protein FJ109_02420 [Deltaproteobacteria bacterium]|nr:hypothetical protein [Deltaproteobacteria bacterium]